MPAKKCLEKKKPFARNSALRELRLIKFILKNNSCIFQCKCSHHTPIGMQLTTQFADVSKLQKQGLRGLARKTALEGGHILPRDFFNGIVPVLNLEACLMAPKADWLKQRAEVLLISQQELKDDETRSIEKISDFTGIRFDLDQLQNRQLIKDRNVGISSERQVQFLLKSNRLNKNLKQVHPRLNLNNKYSRRLGLTPRHIAQHRLADSISAPFNIDFEFSENQKDAIAQDWEHLRSLL